MYEQVKFGEHCIVDFNQRNFAVNGLSRHLQPQEWKLLQAITEKNHRILTFFEISELIWSDLEPNNSRIRSIITKVSRINVAYGEKLIERAGNGYRINVNVNIAIVSNIIGIETARANVFNKLFPGRALKYRDAKYDALLDRKYINRPWLTETVLEAIEFGSRIVSVIGAPGTGKSAFLANFISTHSNIVVAHFFCEWESSNKRDASYLVRELAAQVAASNDYYCTYLNDIVCDMPVESLMSMSVYDLLNTVLINPLIHSNTDNHQILAIDAIDELENYSDFLQALRLCLQHLPNRVGFLITLRDGLLSRQMLKSFKIIDLNNENVASDMIQYIRFRLKGHAYSQTIISSISNRCDGNFLYAQLICDEILEHRVTIDDFIPESIDEIYYEYFQRVFKDEAEYSEKYRQALSVIIASREQLSSIQLQRIMHWDDGEAIKFYNKLGWIINASIFPKKIGLFHKAIGDWLCDIERSGIYYTNKHDGIDVIFYYIYNLYLSDWSSLDYSLIRDWNIYGKESTRRKEYLSMRNDREFILYTAEIARRNSDFNRAILIIKPIFQLSAPTELYSFRASLILQDIYLDLDDIRAEQMLEELLVRQQEFRVSDEYQSIHLFENASWIYMRKKQLIEAEKMLDQAFYLYKNIPVDSKKEISFSHTLYIYSDLLFLKRDFSLCREKLQLSQEIISNYEIIDRSQSYSLGLKLFGWIEQKQSNLKMAEEHFDRALKIQMNVFGEPSIYLAHTLTSLADNEIRLFIGTHQQFYIKKAKENIKKAKEVLSHFDERYAMNLSKLNQLEKRILDADEKKL